MFNKDISYINTSIVPIKNDGIIYKFLGTYALDQIGVSTQGQSVISQPSASDQCVVSVCSF